MPKFPLIALAQIILLAARLSAGETTGDLIARLAKAAPAGGVVADFRETKSLALLRNPVVETGTLAYLQPDFFRRTVKSPVESTMLFDGESLWVIFPGENLAERYPARTNRAIRDSLAGISAIWDIVRLKQRFHVESGIENGNHVLKLTPRERSLRKTLSGVVVTLDSALKLREIRIETVDGNCSRIEILRERPANLTPRDFHFDPQEGGYHVVAPLGTH